MYSLLPVILDPAVVLALVDALPEAALVHLLRDVDVRVGDGDLDDVAVRHRDLYPAHSVPAGRRGIPAEGRLGFRLMGYFWPA